MYIFAVVGEEEGAQHTALWDASVQGEGGGGAIVDPNSLRSVDQEVQNPAAERGVDVPQFGDQSGGVLNAELKSMDSILT